MTAMCFTELGEDLGRKVGFDWLFVSSSGGGEWGEFLRDHKQLQDSLEQDLEKQTQWFFFFFQL